MRKVILLLTLLMSIGFVFAESACTLDVTLLNQDPYPAVPGDYVKLVFQIEGAEAPECGDITFTLLPTYPIELNPGESGIRKFNKVDYVKNYGSNILVPYEVRVDKNAVDGSNMIEIQIKNKNGAELSKTFNLEVEEVKADFEAFVKDFDYTTNELTLGILNIEKSDIEALIVKIPKQDNIIVKGANQIIAGDLDSNEYTTVDFEATPSDGEIMIELIYSDSINTRRITSKTITFDSSYFTNRKTTKKSSGIGGYVFLAIAFMVIGWIVIRKIRKIKKKK